MNKINLKAIQQWIIANYRMVTLAVLALVAGIAIVGSVYRIAEYLHDTNYQKQQSADTNTAAAAETNANTFETNANLHEANADAASNKQKELEKDEKIIKQKRTDQQKVLSNSRQQVSNTREKLNTALSTPLPVRDDNDDADDDQLRTDAATAANTFGKARIKKAATSKP